MSDVLLILTVTCAVGSGLIAGVFFAFSSFVMPALGRTTSPHGAEAMQQINVTVINVPMMGTFLGSGVLCLLLAGLTLWQGDVSAAWLTLTGCGLYVVGTIGVTIVFNVPMNEKLALMPLAESTTADYWQHYLRRWTWWNTVRTLASTAACVVLIVSLLV